MLAPEPQDDGVLYAWEIAELNLAGVELVTLSACESAESVVDIYGNVEGIPVAFLRAGAQAVVGTLWQIETSCSRAFFELLYTQLAGGASRADAFRAAQCEIRRRFPDPQDWSAFFLIGDWR
jgi:CHAT domain-containing protein